MKMKSLLKNKFATLCVLALGLTLTPAVTFAQNPTPAVEKKVEVKQIDDAKLFDKELKDSKTLILVDFTAAWCGPCQMLKPKIEQLAQEFKGKVLFLKVEQTVPSGLVGNYGVTSFPTVKIFEPGGKEVSQSIGNVGIDQLRKWIQSQVDNFDKAQQAQPTPKKP